MDWRKWHGLYDSQPVRRLALLRKPISRCLDARPSGKICVIGVRAGDSRDLLGALERHPCRQDVHARLVELAANLIAESEAKRSSGPDR